MDNAKILKIKKDLKCEEINAKTATDIVNLIGNDVKQRNKTAMGVYLARKENNGSITAEESIILDNYQSELVQVETLRIDGNAREAAVQAMTTISEVDSVIV